MIYRLKMLLAFLFLVSGCCHTQPSSDPMLRIFEDINDFRAEHGLPLLLISENLNCAASLQAADMGFNRRCDGIGADGGTMEDRAYACDTQVEQQIIACGTNSVENTMRSWVMSEDLQVLEEKDLLLMGCAMHNFYWVCTFSY